MKYRFLKFEFCVVFPSVIISISFSVLSCLKKNENPSPFVTHSGEKTLPPTAPLADSF